MKGYKNIFYLFIALGMMIYAIPRLPAGGGWSAPSVFAAVWLCFSILVVAALLYDLLSVEEETRQEMTKLRSMRRRQRLNKLVGVRQYAQARKQG